MLADAGPLGETTFRRKLDAKLTDLGAKIPWGLVEANPDGILGQSPNWVRGATADHSQCSSSHRGQKVGMGFPNASFSNGRARPW